MNNHSIGSRRREVPFPDEGKRHDDGFARGESNARDRDQMRWLVDSLHAWILDMQSQHQGKEGNEFSVFDDNHRAQKPHQQGPKSAALVACNGNPCREGTTDLSQSNPMEELLVKVGLEHQRLLEELRAENKVMRELVRQQATTLSVPKAAKRRSLSCDSPQALQPLMNPIGPTPMISEPVPGVNEACDLFINNEAPPCTQKPERQDSNAESWTPDRRSTTSLHDKVQFEIRRSMGFADRHSTSSQKSAGLDSGLSPAALAGYGCDALEEVQPGASVSVIDEEENEHERMRRSTVAQLGKYCTAFTSEEIVLISSCFQKWGTFAKQMRKPVHFSIREAWDPLHMDVDVMASATFSGRKSHASGVRSQALNASSSKLELVDDEESEDSEYASWAEAGEFVKPSRCDFMIVDPGSNKRLMWDLVGASLLVSDLVLIPMASFQPDWGLFTVIVDWVTLLFWTMDMAASCFTGFMSCGRTVMDPVLILVNYSKTWFILDVLVVWPDWIFLIVAWADTEATGSKGGAGGSSRLLRVLRLIRLARLLRLVKLKRIGAMIRDRIDSEIVFITANIMKLIIMLIAVNHALASVWYLIGTISHGMDVPNWIESDQGFYEATLGYRYTTAMHWSLTQFTPASMSVQPQNVIERTFAISVLVFGLVLFSSFISNITTSMTQLRSMQDDKEKQFWLLRRYLRQHGIPSSLAFRILRYLEYACREQKDLISASRLTILKLASEQLRSELQYVVSFSGVMSHPLFERTNTVSSVTMHRLGGSALSELMLASHDYLFHTGFVAAHMSIIVSGSINYVKTDTLDDGNDSLEKDDWLCESCLWTNWVHLGSAKATKECKLVQIEWKEFQEVIKKDVQVLELTSGYASKYMVWLNKTLRGQLTDVAHLEALHSLTTGFLYDDEEFINTSRSLDPKLKKPSRMSMTMRGAIPGMGQGSKPGRATTEQQGKRRFSTLLSSRS